jgi:hypothetical protein
MLSPLAIAMVIRALDDAVGSWAFMRRGKKYSVTDVSSTVVLTDEELAAWGSSSTTVEERVAIYKRGLLRYGTLQKPREAA